jgi:uncharacterized YigZ family protein
MAHTPCTEFALTTEVKKSRFLAYAAPVDQVDAALAFVQARAHTDATHNCWAYRIGAHYRFNDDGEPAGTAGRPILQAIDNQGYDQTVVLVVRYFGGIKLGAGGLVRAYGGAAASCLRLAPRRAIEARMRLQLQCAFADVGAAHAAMQAHQALKLDEQFDADGVRITIEVRADAQSALAQALRDATRGRAQLRPVTMDA